MTALSFSWPPGPGCRATSGWISMWHVTNLTHLLITCRLFHIFVEKFSAFKFLQTSPDNNIIHIYNDEDDLDQCLYYLRTLSNILRWSSDSLWAILSKNIISTDPAHPALYRISKYLFPMRENNLIRDSWSRCKHITVGIFHPCLLGRNIWDLWLRILSIRITYQSITTYGVNNTAPNPLEPECIITFWTQFGAPFDRQTDPIPGWARAVPSSAFAGRCFWCA